MWQFSVNFGESCNSNVQKYFYHKIYPVSIGDLRFYNVLSMAKSAYAFVERFILNEWLCKLINVVGFTLKTSFVGVFRLCHAKNVIYGHHGTVETYPKIGKNVIIFKV